MSDELKRKIAAIMASATPIESQQPVTPVISVIGSGNVIVGGDVHIGYPIEVEKLIRINDKERPAP